MARMKLAGLSVNEYEEMANYENNKTQLEKFKRVTFFAMKRTFDILCSLLGVLALLPVMFITKICYLISGDKNSIFYKQKRIGKDGKFIYFYKLISMVSNADEILKKLLADPKYKAEWDAYQKFEDDPRITKVGKILRKTSLDELPQFINIIKGDMSLIGPRPLVEGELDLHNGDHSIYEHVRPGITGWWACNGRSEIDYDNRLKLEYYYVQNCSLSLDVKCFFKTIIGVIKKDGAK